MPGLLWERERIVGAVADTLRECRGGRGGTLLAVGEAGTGKTAALDRAVELAVADGFELARGRGDEMEAGIALGLLEQVLRSLDGGQTGQRAAALEPSTPYVQALAQLERRTGRPLLVAVDDLHWADADSLDVLAFLARRIAALPVALVATLRPWPPAADAVRRSLVAAGHARSEPLEPLTRATAGRLLAERTGTSPPPALAQRAWDLCRGNPLLIDQLAAAAGTGLSPEAQWPEPARQLIVARFAGLDERSLRYARCASVLGTSFRPEVAVEIAGLESDDAERALEALDRGGLVGDDGGDRLRFTHQLVREALYEDLAPALRRRLHGAAFHCLARRLRSEEAAEHAARADLRGDRAAGALLERVGRTALREGAAQAAAGHLAAAAELLGDGASPRLLLALAEARCAEGRMPAAAETCRRALARSDIDWRDRIDVLVLLGRCQYLAGADDLGELALEEAVAIAERHQPERAVKPLLDQAVSAWMASGPARALELASRARELTGDDRALRETADAMWGHLAAECGDPAGIAATEPIGRRIRADGAAAELRPAELVTPRAGVYAFAHCAQYAERLDESLAALELARERIESAGAANALATVSLFIGNHLIRRGRLEAALAEADRAERFSELTPLATPFAAAVRAQALLWLGRLEESDSERRRAEAGGSGQWMVRLWVAHVDGLRQLWAGSAAASDAFREVERLSAAAGIAEPSHTLWAGHAVAAHLAAGRLDDADRVVEWLERRAARSPTRWPRFAAALGRGRMAEHGGDHDSAAGAYRDALCALGDVDLPLQRVDGLLAHGGLLRRGGRQVEARPLLAEALQIADAHGAGWLARSARTELSLAGGRRRGPADRDLLTPAETRVARRAATGLTNAEIAQVLHISVNTVETHLKRVYAKLGISGRRRLVGIDLDERSARPHASVPEPVQQPCPERRGR